MRLFYSEDEPEGEAEDEDEEKTKAAVATAFGLATSVFRARRITDNFWKQNNTEKEKLQLDIAALRMQYAKLRERQRQAHVIWTAATSGSSSGASNRCNPVTNLLAGRKPLLVRRPSATSQPPGPRLRLPPTRIPTHPSSSKAYSAPSTPSGDEELPISRRNNSTTSQWPSVAAEPSLKASGSTSMTTSRSRLVQELLEQNSAILHKLKDRSESVHAYPEGEPQDSSGVAPFRHPFPRQINKSPKEVGVKLGLYNSQQKY